MQTATGTSQKESNDIDDDNDGKVLNVEACRTGDSGMSSS